MLSFPKLMNFILGFRSLITTRGSDFGQPLSGETLENNVRYILSIHSSLVICPKDEEHIVKFQVGEDETVDAMKFQHYANQFLPLVMPFCLLSILSNEDSLISLSDDLMDEYIFLRHILYEDFIYQKATEVEVIQFWI